MIFTLLFFKYLMNLPHLPTFALFHQDTILHIREVHQQQVHLKHNLIRVLFFNSFLLPSSQCGAYSLHWYKRQYCFCVDCILQILFSSYLILSPYRQSIIIYKNQKHSNQFTMSLLFCVILLYRNFFPLFLPLSEFVNTHGTI